MLVWFGLLSCSYVWQKVDPWWCICFDLALVTCDSIGHDLKLVINQIAWPYFVELEWLPFTSRFVTADVTLRNTVHDAPLIHLGTALVWSIKIDIKVHGKLCGHGLKKFGCCYDCSLVAMRLKAIDSTCWMSGEPLSTRFVTVSACEGRALCNRRGDGHWHCPEADFDCWWCIIGWHRPG